MSDAPAYLTVEEVAARYGLPPRKTLDFADAATGASMAVGSRRPLRAKSK